MKSKDLWRFWKKAKKTDDCWVWTATAGTQQENVADFWRSR